MKRIALHWQILIGLVLGIVWAMVSAELGWQEFTIEWIGPWGEIFINVLKLIALPLVFFSIVVGVASLSDLSKLGRIGIKTLGAYLVTTVLAVTTGLLLVNIFSPGKQAEENRLITNRISYELWIGANESVDFLDEDDRRFAADPEYADYLAEAAELNAKHEQSDIVASKKGVLTEQKEKGPLQGLVDIFPSNIIATFDQDKGTMLQIIFFAIFFGISLAMIDGGKARPVISLFDGLNEVFIKMVNVVMLGAPFFVFALLAGKMAEMAGDDPGEVISIFQTLAGYVLVTLLGLALMIFLFYPMILKLFVRKMHYRKFFRGIGRAQVTAFSTSSSAATLPITLDCVNNGLGVSKRVSDFVLPIGATVNMDGTSLYQAIAVIFLAQYHMVDLDIATQLTIVLTATLASIGSAAVPSAGLIMMMLILESVGLNPAWIAIIFPVDRILDMCRTVVNVTGDATVSSIIANSEGELTVPEED